MEYSQEQSPDSFLRNLSKFDGIELPAVGGFLDPSQVSRHLTYRLEPYEYFKSARHYHLVYEQPVVFLLFKLEVRNAVNSAVFPTAEVVEA